MLYVILQYIISYYSILCNILQDIRSVERSRGRERRGGRRPRRGGSQERQIRRHPTCYFHKRATSAPAELGGKFTTSRKIEPARTSCRRHRSCTFAEVAARLVPSGQRGPPACGLFQLAHGSTRECTTLHIGVRDMGDSLLSRGRVFNVHLGAHRLYSVGWRVHVCERDKPPLY